jgi:hypothetical protein
MGQINIIGDVEDIEVLRATINDFRRNPVDLEGEPDGLLASKFSRFVEAVNARVKEIDAEDERRKALNEETRQKEEAERAKKAAEELAKKKEEAAAKVAAAQDKVEEERAKVEQEASGESDVPKGKDYSKMSNAELVKEIRGLMKENEFNQARAVMAKMKAVEGYDLDGEQAKLKEDMTILFNNVRQEMQASYNDARQFNDANMVNDARKSIKRAADTLQKLIDNCIDDTIKAELTAIQPRYEQLYRKIFQ